MILYQSCLDLSNHLYILPDQRQDAGTQRPRCLPLGLVERPGVERIDQCQHQAGVGRALPHPPLDLGHRQVVMAGDGRLIQPGVHQRRLQPLVAQHLLDGQERCTGVQKQRRLCHPRHHLHPSEDSGQAYDPLNRLISATYSTPSTGSGQAAGEQFEYAYDEVGNRTVMTDATGVTTYILRKTQDRPTTPPIA